MLSALAWPRPVSRSLCDLTFSCFALPSPSLDSYHLHGPGQSLDPGYARKNGLTFALSIARIIRAIYVGKVKARERGLANRLADKKLFTFFCVLALDIRPNLPLICTTLAVDEAYTVASFC